MAASGMGRRRRCPLRGLWKAEVASRIVANHYNRISESLFCDSEQYVPLYEVDDDSDEPLWEPWISGFERAMRMRPDAWERVVDSSETEAAASVNMILALYDIGQGQSDLAERVGQAIAEIMAGQVVFGAIGRRPENGRPG